MSFVNPSLLWALPLVAAPVLIHLLFRWRHRAVVFSDLGLLREVIARVMPRRRLEEWLLTAVRCALVLLLILAFARPVLHGGAGAAPTEKESLDLVVLLDGSYSMGALTLGRSRFDRAKAAAAALLRSLRAQDRAAVVLFSDRLEGSSGDLQTGADRLVSWVARAAPGLHGTDYRLALESAYSLLSRSQAGRKAIVVLSDNAHHGFRTLDPKAAATSLPFFDPKVKLAGLAWDEPPANVSVEATELHENELRVSAALSGKAAVTTDLTLWEGARAAGKRRLPLRPGRTGAAFPVAPANGVFSGRVEARHDALAADDAFYFAYAVREAPRPFVIEAAARDLPANSGAWFLKRALEANRLPAPAVLEPIDVSESRLREAKTVVLLSPSRLNAASALALEAWVRAGGGLWVFPDGEPESLKALSPFLPARAERSEARGAGLVPAAAAAWRVPFSWTDFDLGRVELRRSLALQPREGSAVEFKDGRGAPILVSGRLGRGRILLAAFSLKPSWTNLSLKPVFAPWAAAGLARLAESADGEPERMLRLEEVWQRSWRDPERPPAALTVLSPDGAATRVPVTEGRAQFARTDRPGLYRVTAEGRPDDVFAVDLDPALRESDLRMEEEPPWVLLREESFARDFQRILFGQEARHWVLLVILLLLVAEAILSKPPEVSPAPPASRLAGTPPKGRGSVVGVGAVVAFLLLVAPPLSAQVTPEPAQSGDRFTWAQLKVGSGWDPYPQAWPEISDYLRNTTSVPIDAPRRVVALGDPALFASPFLVLTGKDAPPDLTDGEAAILRRYLSAGGFLWIEDASGLRASPFDRWARREMAKVLPDTPFEILQSTHAIFRSFYLLRSIGGRVLVQPSLEGLPFQDRTAVLYTRNDLEGSWLKDSLGNYLYPCTPGGEPQRAEARKLTINILLYALTGSYKLDAVHQPFILEKLRSMSQ